MKYIPAGILEWTFGIFGLFLIIVSIWGMKTPRAWIEWIERRFTYTTNLHAIGLLILLGAGTIYYFAGSLALTLNEALFLLVVEIMATSGLGLLFFQNHLRHIVIATAEWSDLKIKLACIVAILAGLALVALAIL